MRPALRRAHGIYLIVYAYFGFLEASVLARVADHQRGSSS